jgi:pimeloyl-ACP methyl ester carboxylesterase
MSETSAIFEDEFALLTEVAGEVGHAATDIPTVNRRWVNPETSLGHVSALIWGASPAEIVLLHDVGRSARAWDAVVLAADVPTVALDLPGHGRSSWRRDGDYHPRRLVGPVADALRSFAPGARLVAGHGFGGLVAIALTARHGDVVPRLVLVDALPALPDGTSGNVAGPWTVPGPFRSLHEVDAALVAGSERPTDPATLREAHYELEYDDDSALKWRHHPGNLPGSTAADFDDATLWDQLAAVTVPVTVVTGGGSTRVSPAQLDELARRVPHADVVTIPDAAYDAVTRQPVAVATAITARLDESAIPTTASR